MAEDPDYDRDDQDGDDSEELYQDAADDYGKIERGEL